MHQVTMSYPKFENGVILRAERLQEIVNHTFMLSDFLFSSNENGIVVGCSVEKDDSVIVMQPGIICFEKMLYIFEEKISFEYQPTNELVYMKILLTGTEYKKDRTEHIFSISLNNEKPKRNR